MFFSNSNIGVCVALPLPHMENCGTHWLPRLKAPLLDDPRSKPLRKRGLRTGFAWPKLGLTPTLLRKPPVYPGGPRIRETTPTTPLRYQCRLNRLTLFRTFPGNLPELPFAQWPLVGCTWPFVSSSSGPQWKYCYVESTERCSGNCGGGCSWQLRLCRKNSVPPAPLWSIINYLPIFLWRSHPPSSAHFRHHSLVAEEMSIGQDAVMKPPGEPPWIRDQKLRPQREPCSHPWGLWYLHSWWDIDFTSWDRNTEYG